MHPQQVMGQSGPARAWGLQHALKLAKTPAVAYTAMRRTGSLVRSTTTRRLPHMKSTTYQIEVDEIWSFIYARAHAADQADAAIDELPWFDGGGGGWE